MDSPEVSFLNGSSKGIAFFILADALKTNILTWFERATLLKTLQNNTPKINFFICRKLESLFFSDVIGNLKDTVSNLRCGAVQRELSFAGMRCGAACGQGLRTQRSMRMYFFLSVPSLVWCTWIVYHCRG